MINIIQSFVRAVCFFSRGNIQEHINLETHDELSQLADSFNNMANELQSIEYENSLRVAMDKARSIIFMKDVSGRYIYANRLYGELSHIDNAAIQGKTDHDIFPQQIADIFHKNEQEVIQSGYPLEVEELIPHNDGIHTYSSFKFPLQRVSGEIYAVCGIATDITKRKQTEQSQIESEAFHHAIFDATPDAMIISDKQGVITLVNQQVEYLLGYRPEELLEKSIGVLMPESVRSRHKVLSDMYIAAPSPRSMGTGREVRALRKDGCEIDVDISLSPIQTRQGMFIASALRDITQRKQAEAELRIAATAFESHEAMVSPKGLNPKRKETSLLTRAVMPIRGICFAVRCRRKHSMSLFRCRQERIYC